MATVVATVSCYMYIDTLVKIFLQKVPFSFFFSFLVLDVGAFYCWFYKYEVNFKADYISNTRTILKEALLLHLTVYQ